MANKRYRPESNLNAALPLAVIGAIQRSNPVLAALFLQWTGIASGDKVVFNVMGNEGVNATMIDPLGTADNVLDTRDQLCDFLGIPEGQPERSQGRLVLNDNSPYHGMFWAHAINRDAKLSPSPLEFWLALSTLRHGGIVRTTAMLLEALGVNDKRLGGAVCSLYNPKFDATARTLKAALAPAGGAYTQPRALDFTLRLPSVGSGHARGHEIITIPLKDGTRDVVADALMRLAITVDN